MKLGTETGSVCNHLLSRATIGQPAPVVGLGVTFLLWTDRDPGTIYEVFAKGKFLYIVTRKDDYRRTDSNGCSESQEYEYTPRPDGRPYVFRRPLNDADASWRHVTLNEKGRYVLTGSRGLHIGEREKYHDFSF